MPVKIALIQMASSWEDPGATLKRVEYWCEKAVEQGANLVCFPEQVATGWSPAHEAFAEPLFGPISGTFARLARTHKLHLLGSFVEEGTPRPFNTCAVFTPEGTVSALYRKIHLFSPSQEDDHVQPGNALAVFQVQDCLLGIAICYDLRFSPLFAHYARSGVHGVIIPAAWPCARIEQWELLISGRALEFQYVVAGVNCTGQTPSGTYCGRSLAADPTGRSLCNGGGEEEVLLLEIDPAMVAAARTALPVFRDFRWDLYPHLQKDRG